MSKDLELADRALDLAKRTRAAIIGGDEAQMAALRAELAALKAEMAAERQAAAS